ncbi:MAG: hypothetical protein P8P29_06510 [Flavobacteriaceae bacterium]|nr:hypothetical protein [Flavobacteriaceae bacterium]
MKKTEYFASNHAAFNGPGLESCIQSAKQKRDTFFEENKETIAKIDSEDIKVVAGNPSNNHIKNVMVIIQVTYYTK